MEKKLKLRQHWKSRSEDNMYIALCYGLQFGSHVQLTSCGVTHCTNRKTLSLWFIKSDWFCPATFQSFLSLSRHPHWAFCKMNAWDEFRIFWERGHLEFHMTITMDKSEECECWSVTAFDWNWFCRTKRVERVAVSPTGFKSDIDTNTLVAITESFRFVMTTLLVCKYYLQHFRVTLGEFQYVRVDEDPVPKL